MPPSHVNGRSSLRPRATDHLRHVAHRPRHAHVRTCARSAVPFKLRDPTTLEPVLGAGEAGSSADSQLTLLWAGIKKACCMRQNYALKFPAGIDAAMKATIVGAAMLVDFTFFEEG